MNLSQVQTIIHNMAGEKLVFATPEFKNPIINKERSSNNPGLDDSEALVAEFVDFNPDSFARLIRLSKKDGKTKWANAVCYDFKRGIQFYYDHNFVKEGLSHFFGKDPYAPYQAVISFSSCEESEDGRIASAVKYGAFYYDREGKLRTVKTEQITQGFFQHNVPSVHFRQREDGLWSVFPVGDLQEPMRYYFTNGRKPLEPSTAILVDGKEIEVFEMVYSLTESNGRIKVVQHSVTGHVQKTMEVPLTVDIPRWSYLLRQENGEWVKAFSEFPSYIEITR